MSDKLFVNHFKKYKIQNHEKNITNHYFSLLPPFVGSSSNLNKDPKKGEMNIPKVIASMMKDYPVQPIKEK